MKINVLAVLGLSLLGSGHAEVVSEASEVSNFQRKLAISLGAGCDSTSATDKCCNGDGAIENTCTQVDEAIGDFVVPKGSCNGQTACNRVGDLTIGEYTCIGENACTAAAFGWNVPGKATVGSNSCYEKQACASIGARNGETTIGSNSCTNRLACYMMGAKDGHVVIGDESCNLGWKSCFYLGHNFGKAVVGKGSCGATEACMHNSHNVLNLETTIGDRSCNGEAACYDVAVTIGSDSCNCPDCCKCVPDGSIIPDNKCNSLGGSEDQCCNTDGTLNENFDFSNMANYRLTPPTPPGGYDAPPEYDIALSSCDFTPDSVGSDIGDITCTFNTFGGVDYSVSSAIYNADCSSAVAPTGVSEDASPSFSPALINGSTTQESSTYAVTVSLASSAAPSDSSYIAFCLKTEVKDKDGDVYDWIGQKIKLDVNLDGTFSTDSLSTTTFDGTTAVAADAGDASFGVGIKRCDSSGNDVTDDTELSLGENFFLCVEGDRSAVVINSIREMTATKDGVTDLNLVTTVGDGSGEGDRNPNTFVYGYGSNKVVIATRLPAPFFVAGGAVTLSGTANISTGGRRRLGRSMQEASSSSKKESAGFSMEVNIAGSSDASSASAIKATTAVFFSVVAAVLFV